MSTSPINATANKPPILVAMAILFQEGKFLMQLRDDIPGILYPGYWGFFGGHLEPGETPKAGVIREVKEEIGYCLNDAQLFDCYGDTEAYRYIFYAPLQVPLAQLDLQEGWDLGLITPEAIAKGVAYSEKAKQERPLGPIHQTILLDFLNARLH
jgi:8-oxo-dGTP pyrophosphatase MutT (NUDIX family)